MIVKLAFSVMALAIGTAFAVQSGINAGLARHIGSAICAALISFGVGTVALIVLALASGQIASIGAVRGAPFWLWAAGGLLGCGIVYGSIFLVPRIGVASLAAFIIAGQLSAAAVIDHFGIFGVPVHEINLWRIVGIAMLLSGALLVRLN